MDNPWWSQAFANPDTRRFFGDALSDFGYGLATSTNVGNAFGAAAQRGMEMAPYRDAQQQQREEEAKAEEMRQKYADTLRSWGGEYSDLAEGVLAGGIDPAQAYLKGWERRYAPQGSNLMSVGGHLYDQSTGQWISPPEGAGGSTEFGLTPIWGQMPDGSFGYGVQGKDGSFRQVDTGDLSPLDPRSLAGERAFGTAVGGAQGDAVAGAPGDITAGTTALSLIDQIKTHPELDWATGFSVGLGGNAVPGTGRYGFQNLVDQAKSGAFLTAIQEMRGMGALSNAEGQTATQAVTRMNTALSKEDFLKAVEDYERIVRIGIERAQARLGSGPNVNVGRPQTGGGPAPSGNVLTFNPATGRLE